MTSNSIDLGKAKQAVLSKSNTLNVERNIKTLLRLLRKSVKRHFDNCHKKKHYYWNDKNLRLRTLKFFTEALDVPSEFYAANEEAFFKIVHNTKEICESDEIGGSCMKHMAVTDLFKEVFGQHPNKKNLIKFFTSPVVQFLWKQFFVETTEYKGWKVTFQSHAKSQQAKMLKYTSEVCKHSGFNFLA